MRTCLIAAIAASVALGGCQVRAEGGGSTVTRNFQIGNFQQIDVAGPYEVEVRTCGNPGVSARGSEKLLERTVAEVQGVKLIIHPEQHSGWFNFGWHDRGKANFTVTVPQLSCATIAGRADIHV